MDIILPRRPTAVGGVVRRGRVVWGRIVRFDVDDPIPRGSSTPFTVSVGTGINKMRGEITVAVRTTTVNNDFLNSLQN